MNKLLKTLTGLGHRRQVPAPVYDELDFTTHIRLSSPVTEEDTFIIRCAILRRLAERPIEFDLPSGAKYTLSFNVE